MITRYRLTEELATDSRFGLSRGWLDGHDRPVLIRHPLNRPAPAADRNCLAREFEILGNPSLEGLARAITFIDADDCALVMEDQAVRTLAAVIGSGPLPLGWVLDYAIQLVEILSGLHAAGLVHRGLMPQSILIQPRSGRVQLTDFSEAVRTAAEACVPLPPYRYASRLPYCAPEETGRVSRACDYRTDLYALGAVLYQLLTGRPPFFECADPLELIHAHIAKRPPPPDDLVVTVPLPVSQIVMKLLAKPAEERYQSAIALESDLQRCRREWSDHGRVLPFSIAAGDVSERFAIPRRLFGRDAELAQLRCAFDRMCEGDGPAALLLVGGHAGVGKTAFVGELQQHACARRANFVSGKFDQLSRDVPYEAVLQALSQLVRCTLAEPAAELGRQRAQLQDTLGTLAAVIADVIPELALVLGPQRPAPWLPPTEARNRFNLAFQKFVAAMASPERPLVILLDDLHWVDRATLQLLEALLRSQDIRNLLLIGAYRNNEVDAGHPLSQTIAALETASVPLQRIVLPSLGPDALTQLSAATLHVAADGESQAAALARHLLAKTDGNPFFVMQFLRTLHQDGMIVFDAAQSNWRCDLAAIAEVPITSNVVSLMSRRIDRLTPAARDALALAACIGNRFEMQTLATVTDRSQVMTLDDIAQAVAEGLIVPEAAGTLRFLHDRVQQAAYARIAEADKPRVHLRIGRLLWDRRHALRNEVGEAVGEGLFDLVSHLNLGARLIESSDEKIALARMNLAAGNRAKSSAAFTTAFGYFSAGIGLLDGDWQTDHALAFSLHLEAAQCEYLLGNFERAEDMLGALLPRAKSDLDRVRVHSLRMIQFENRACFAESIASARAGLALFGVTLPEAEADKLAALQREIESIDALIGQRPIASLIELPVMADPALRMVMSVLTDAWSPAYIFGDGPLARLLSALLVRLSLQHGNVEESAYGYVTHAITVGPVRGDYEAAWEFGNLALQVNERFSDTRRRAKIQQQFHAHVNLWRRPFASCIPYAREARRSGLESGDFLYAAYGAGTESWTSFIAADSLGQFVDDCAPNLALIERLKNQGFADALKLMMQWARALQGETAAPLSLTSGDFDESAYVATYRGNPFFSMFHTVVRIQLCYTLEDYAGALADARALRATAYQLIGMIWSVLFDFWGGLTLAACYQEAAATDREVWLQDMRAAQRSLEVLARNCPENYLCMARLLTGEIERVAGNPLSAIESFEQAIDAAQRSGSVHCQALANELLARLWLQRGNRRVASMYLQTARERYATWGARAKTRSLDERHRDLLALGAHEPAGPGGRRQSESFEVAALGKAALAIAGNVDLEALLRQMLTIALEDAGASHGVLIEVADAELFVVAESDAESAAVTLLQQTPLSAGAPCCSRAVVNYVHRTRASLVLSDAAFDERFARDEYLAKIKPRSVLCLPALHQGRSGAIVYLENRLDRDAFVSGRIELIQLLAGYVATSLESARLVSRMQQETTDRQRAELALHAIEAGTATMTGGDFFRALVRNLAQTLQVRYVFAAECLAADTRTGVGVDSARTRAFWKGDDFGDDFQYPLMGTPCREVSEGRICHHAADVAQLFPRDRYLAVLRAQCYVGVPLIGSAGEVIGHIALFDTRPLPDASLALAVLKVCAGRAGAELERLKAEEGMKRALAEVEQLTSRLQNENVYLRRELIANVSHDLRSPLASLRGYLDTLLIKEELLSTAERHAYLAVALRQAEHLQKLISELFDLAKLDFQGYQINREPMHVGELARDVLQKFQLPADSKRVTLRIDASPDAGFVQADISLIERTLENLIENALAHTPAGGTIELGVRTVDGQVTIQVSDTGCGIGAPDLPHVFERFYRGDKARGLDAGSSGLGLAIVKRIVELHSSEIRVESGTAGTRFWFTLPVSPHPADAALAGAA